MDWEQAREALVPEDGALFHRGRASRPVELPELPAPVVDTHGHLLLLHKTDPAVALARRARIGDDEQQFPVVARQEIPKATYRLVLGKIFESFFKV